MESYEAIPVWNVVSIKSVPRGTRIFRLKWVFVMKNVPGSECSSSSHRAFVSSAPTWTPSSFPASRTSGARSRSRSSPLSCGAHGRLYGSSSG
jgi:hypothetical protein